MGVYLDIKKSLQRDLVTFSLTNLTDFQQGTMPAVEALDLGVTLYRTDEDKLYQLQSGVTELGKEWVAAPYDFFFVDFDAHSQIQELPQHHLVGTKAIGATTDEHFVEGMALIGVAMFNDVNFNKHDIVIDKLFSRYLPTKSVPVFQQSDGARNGALIIQNGTEVMPIAKADQRPLQFLSLLFSTDRTVNLS